jgi:hypothetical protein
MKADMKSNNHEKTQRTEDYQVSVCGMRKEGDEHPLTRLKRRIQEARDRAKDARAEVNTTKSE